MSLEMIQREHVISGVAPRVVYAVIVDFACYPRIFPEFTGTRMIEPDLVEFRARVVVELRYVLRITRDDEHHRMSWKFVEGEVVSDSEGGWELDGDERETRIRYRAGVAIKAPLPKVVVNKISNVLLGTSIPNMFRALEREALARRKYAPTHS